MLENRLEERHTIQTRGLFLQDGSLFKVNLRDVARSGLGAFTSRELKPGQQGIIFTKLPYSTRIEEFISEVCWCMSDPMAPDSAFPYRIGFRFLGDGRF